MNLNVVKKKLNKVFFVHKFFSNKVFPILTLTNVVIIQSCGISVFFKIPDFKKLFL